MDKPRSKDIRSAFYFFTWNVFFWGILLMLPTQIIKWAILKIPSSHTYMITIFLIILQLSSSLISSFIAFKCTVAKYFDD
jgi:hypothetical protein